MNNLYALVYETGILLSNVCVSGIILIGEIGGTAEEDAAALIKVIMTMFFSCHCHPLFAWFEYMSN